MPSTPALPADNPSARPSRVVPGAIEAAWVAFCAGEASASERLWTACREYLLLVARQELPAEFAAKVAPSDVVQETLGNAQQKFGEFRGRSEAEFLTWLRRILQNHLIDVRRRFVVSEKRELAREISLEELGGADELPEALAVSVTPWRQLAGEERDGRLARAVAGLPEDYRRVIVERIWERRPFAEIAAGWSRSPEAVRKLWLRALAQLAREWPRDDSAPLG